VRFCPIDFSKINHFGHPRKENTCPYNETLSHSILRTMETPPLSYQIPGRSLLLGSASPRRAELLQRAGFSFTTVRIECDESHPQGQTAAEQAIDLSQRKAKAYPFELAADELLLTADTVVWCRGEHLAKPTDREDALRMLSSLSGTEHSVVTGCTLRTAEGMYSFSEQTDLVFRSMDPAVMAAYIDHSKPFDKAGAYGLQEWIGLTQVERIEGCSSNVIGLPIPRLIRELSDAFGLKYLPFS